MRHRLTFPAAVLAALALTGCATGPTPAGVPAPDSGNHAGSPHRPVSDVIASGSDDEQARARRLSMA